MKRRAQRSTLLLFAFSIRTALRQALQPLLVLLVVAAACGGKESSSSDDEPGAIFVQVLDVRGATVEGAVITTEPPTESTSTDAAGTALIDGIAPGFYRVSAIADDAAGAEPVEVRSGKLAELSVTLESPPLGGSAGTGSAGRSSGSSGSGFGGSVGSAGRGGSSGFGGSGGNPVEGLDFIDARTQVEQMLVDPSRPTLYALDRVNNSLLFIDLDSREVTKTIFVGSSPVDMDLDDEGNELFIANFGSTELAIVDLEAQEIARTIFVDPSLGTWEGNPYRIALMAENTLVFTSEDQWCDLKLVNATNGGHIAATGSLYSPDLAATADGTRLFVGESGGNLYRFDLADSMLTEADVSSAGGSRLVTLSGDEQYVFYGGQKILASNLKSVLGDFSDEIHLSNEDGSLVVSTSRVFDGTTFAIIGLLPITTPTLAASPDFTTLYLYELTSSRIYLYDLSEYAE